MLKFFTLILPLMPTGILVLVLLVIKTPSAHATQNKKPKAVITLAPAANEQSVIRLIGSRSYHKDGSISAYQWIQTKGVTVVINNPNSATASFTAPKIPKTKLPTKALSLPFRLTVTDNLGGTSRGTSKTTDSSRKSTSRRSVSRPSTPHKQRSTGSRPPI